MAARRSHQKTTFTAWRKQLKEAAKVIDKDEFYDIENTIGKSLRECASQTPPPFESIAGRIAAGEPRQSFEEFFAGEVMPVQSHSACSSRNFNWKLLAGGVAAALLFFFGGGAILSAVLGETMLSAKSSDAATEYAEYCDDYDDSFANKSVAECGEEDCKENVSDSDLADVGKNESADSSGNNNS